ncbi:MAG: ketopantoate reductase family protein [Gaiella sp.]
MRVAVVGAGAMGSVYAGLLAGAADDLVIVDPWREHIVAVREHGLRVSGASGDRTVAVRAVGDAAEVGGTVDLVVLATKALDVERAARAAVPLLGPETLVLALQNGLGSAELVGRVIGRERLLVGIAGGFGASIRAPGWAHHEGMQVVRIGQPGGPAGARARQVVALWQAAGLPAEACDDVDRLVWEKLVCNACFSGPCGVLDTPIGMVLDDPDAWAVAAACATEAAAVARALGVALSFDDAVATARAFGERIRGARPSLLLDLRAGRPTEIAFINGAVPRAGAAVGVDAPTNATVAALVAALERSGAHRVVADTVPVAT